MSGTAHLQAVLEEARRFRQDGKVPGKIAVDNRRLHAELGQGPLPGSYQLLTLGRLFVLHFKGKDGRLALWAYSQATGRSATGTGTDTRFYSCIL